MPELESNEKSQVEEYKQEVAQNGTVQHKHESLRAHARPYDDNEDHEHVPPMNFKRLMAFVAMAFLWTGSQIPIYFYGGIFVYVYGDIGGSDRWVWMILANLIALAAVCPFVGSLSDLLGRRWVAIIGAVFLVIGQAVCFSAKHLKSMNVFICGMALSGVGAGIEELTALAATSEMAPTASRGKYVAILIFSILPFVPSVLYGGLIARHIGWQWNSLICGVWCFIGLVMTVVFYFPPPRPNSSGLTRRQILGQIDYVGGFLSISGLIMLLGGLQWGGSQVWKKGLSYDILANQWSSTHGHLLMLSHHWFSEVFC
jgi:MFS family permease